MDRNDILAAYGIIRPHVMNTPLVRSHTLGELTGCTTWFKLENFQMTGSFKERGALNRIHHMTAAERARGIMAASAGNHAQGVAISAERMGIDAVIVMPVNTPLIKVSSTEYHGARVVLHGETYDEAAAYAKCLAADEGRVFIHAFDDDLVIAGQGTIGKELLDHELGPDIDAVVCPVGGGGLIGGIAAYIKETRPDVRIIGVEAERFASMKAGLDAGGLVTVSGGGSLADGIAVRTVSGRTLDLARRYVDDMLTVTEDEIANAVMLFLEIEKIVVEGAGAVTLAALLNRDHGLGGRTVVSVLSGGNIDVNMLSRIIHRGLAVDGRIAHVRLSLRDYPGALADALNVIRDCRANVLSVDHHRFDGYAPVSHVEVTLYLETKGCDHITAITKALGAADITVVEETGRCLRPPRHDGGH